VDAETARERLLEHADRLFYGQGLQTVSVHDVRAASGVSLKRLYQYYPSKEALIGAYLARRDQRWRAELRAFVTSIGETPAERILLVFDSLEAWFRQPEFRGCAFINAFGELGEASSVVAEAARHHKAALFAFLLELASDTGATEPELLARQLAILVDGAIVSASFNGDPAAARWARDAAAILVGGDASAVER
jgi:AcrR family transcriptional regulator